LQLLLGVHEVGVRVYDEFVRKAFGSRDVSLDHALGERLAGSLQGTQGVCETRKILIIMKLVKLKFEKRTTGRFFFFPHEMFSTSGVDDLRGPRSDHIFHIVKILD
jgi:hypothetical protein